MIEFIFPFLWLAFDLFSLNLFFDSFFQKQNRGGWRFFIYGIFVAGGSVLLMFLPQSVRPFVTIVLFALFQQHMHQATGMSLIFFATIFYSIPCTIDNLAFTSLLAWGDWQYTDLRMHGFVYLGLGTLVHGIAMILCLLFNNFRKAKIKKLTNRNWYSIPAVISALCILVELYLNLSFQQNQIEAFPLAVCAAFIAIFNLASLLLVNWIEQNAQLREETLTLHAQISAQEEGIQALSQSNSTQRKLTHDFHAHLDALECFLKEGHYSQAKEYIRQLRKEQTERIFLVNTHHAVVDAILNQKANIAKQRNIDIQFSVNDLSPLRINAIDLTVFIGNLMDNAIEASEKLPEKERQIHVKAILEDAFFFSIRNRSQPVQIEQNFVATTKSDTLLHGYGLKNVQKTLKKYGAYFGIDYQNGWFLAYAELPNTQLL